MALVSVAVIAGPGRAHESRAPAAPLLTTAPALPVIRPAPDLDLTDTEGTAVRLADLRGRPVLISFIYTRCTTACPLVTRRIAALQRRAVEGGLAGRVAFLSVTVDPERDSAGDLAAYAGRFAADLRSWRFLRGETARLTAVLGAWDEWTRRLPGGDIDHPARLYLVDARGRIREIYALEFFDERQAWLDIQALLRGR